MLKDLMDLYFRKWYLILFISIRKIRKKLEMLGF